MQSHSQDVKGIMIVTASLIFTLMPLCAISVKLCLIRWLRVTTVISLYVKTVRFIILIKGW